MLRQMLRRWTASNLPDREQARRARLLNMLALAFLAGVVALLLIGPLVWLWARRPFSAFVFVAAALLAGGLVGVYTLSRAGRLYMAAWLLEALMSAALLGILVAMGHRSSVPIFVPVVILSAAVLVHRRAALVFTVLWAGIYLVTAVAEVNGLFEPLFIPAQGIFPTELWITGRLLGIGLAGVLSWLLAGTLLDAVSDARRNLVRARQREDELERARNSLSQQVRERTHDLEHALVDVQESMLEQESLLRALHRQSIPVVPLFQQIIALPVVGVLDTERAEQLLSSLLEGVEQYDARVALLDLTGVPVLDAAAAAGLDRAVSGARLLGAECVLVGVNPKIAAGMADLGVDYGGLTSRIDMEAGLRYALYRLYGTSDPASFVIQATHS